MPPHPTSWRFSFTLSPLLCLGLQSGLFLSDLSTKTLYAPLLFPYMPHASPIVFFLIWSPEWCLVSSHYKAPRYVVFSIPLSPRPSYAQIYSSVPFLRYPHPESFPQRQRPSFTPTAFVTKVFESTWFTFAIIGFGVRFSLQPTASGTDFHPTSHLKLRHVYKW
jgi:hypothetical protein